MLVRTGGMDRHKSGSVGITFPPDPLRWAWVKDLGIPALFKGRACRQQHAGEGTGDVEMGKSKGIGGHQPGVTRRTERSANGRGQSVGGVNRLILRIGIRRTLGNRKPDPSKAGTRRSGWSKRHGFCSTVLRNRRRCSGWERKPRPRVGKPTPQIRLTKTDRSEGIRVTFVFP